MSTVLVFNPISDLSGSQTDDNEVTLTWSAATRILELVNLNAEDNTVSGAPIGWTVLAGNFIVNVNSNRFPPEGLNIFGTGPQATSRASQRFSPLTYGLTIDQIDNDALTLTVDWWGGTFVQVPADQPKLLIHFYDESLSLISTHDSGFKDPTTLYGTNIRWDEYQETPTVPIGTRFIDIELWANRRTGGNNDAAFDDIRFSFEGEAALPFVPGYAIYEDGVLVATASTNATEYVRAGVADGEHDYKVVAYDGTNFLSGDSNEVTLTVAPDLDPDVTYDVFLFDDEEIFTGYLGGKLRGKTVACPGRNANTARKCGGREN